MRRVADSKREAGIAIPLVVRLAIERVEPLAIVIAVGVQEVRIAIGIAQDIAYVTAP